MTPLRMRRKTERTRGNGRKRSPEAGGLTDHEIRAEVVPAVGSNGSHEHETMTVVRRRRRPRRGVDRNRRRNVDSSVAGPATTTGRDQAAPPSSL